MRRTILPLLAAVAVAGAGCGESSPASTHVSGDTLTIYASLPANGPGAPAGAAAARGMRRALAEAHGRADGRKIRFVQLSSTRTGDETWDPGTVEANAERAADDRSTIAYLGELDQGASAVSLPVTNREDILQVSPADGLTSLTRMPPGRPRAGPERYYPGELRTFVRLVPPDLVDARRIVASLREDGIRQLAVVEGDGIASRELEAMVLALIGERQPQTIDRFDAPDADDDEQSVTDTIDAIVAARPQAVFLTGTVSTRFRAALAERLPGVPLFALPAGPAGRYAGACRSVELLGHRAMRIALEAIDSAGPNRRVVVRAARRANGVSRCR